MHPLKIARHIALRMSLDTYMSVGMLVSYKLHNHSYRTLNFVYFKLGALIYITLINICAAYLMDQVQLARNERSRLYLYTYQGYTYTLLPPEK